MKLFDDSNIVLLLTSGLFVAYSYGLPMNPNEHDDGQNQLPSFSGLNRHLQQTDPTSDGKQVHKLTSIVEPAINAPSFTIPRCGPKETPTVVHGGSCVSIMYNPAVQHDGQALNAPSSSSTQHQAETEARPGLDVDINVAQQPGDSSAPILGPSSLVAQGTIHLGSTNNPSFLVKAGQSYSKSPNQIQFVQRRPAVKTVTSVDAQKHSQSMRPSTESTSQVLNFGRPTFNTPQEKKQISLRPHSTRAPLPHHSQYHNHFQQNQIQQPTNNTHNGSRQHHQKSSNRPITQHITIEMPRSRNIQFSEAQILMNKIISYTFHQILNGNGLKRLQPQHSELGFTHLGVALLYLEAKLTKGSTDHAELKEEFMRLLSFVPDYSDRIQLLTELTLPDYQMLMYVSSKFQDVNLIRIALRKLPNIYASLYELVPRSQIASDTTTNTNSDNNNQFLFRLKQGTSEFFFSPYKKLSVDDIDLASKCLILRKIPLLRMVVKEVKMYANITNYCFKNIDVFPNVEKVEILNVLIKKPEEMELAKQSAKARFPSAVNNIKITVSYRP